MSEEKCDKYSATFLTDTLHRGLALSAVAAGSTRSEIMRVALREYLQRVDKTGNALKDRIARQFEGDWMRHKSSSPDPLSDKNKTDFRERCYGSMVKDGIDPTDAEDILERMNLE